MVHDSLNAGGSAAWAEATAGSPSAATTAAGSDVCPDTLLQEASETKRDLNGKRATAALLGLVAAALLVSGSLVACGPSSATTTGSGSVTASSTGAMGGVASPKVTGVAAPAAPDFTTPLAAVKSYLAWTSYAYRIGNSDVATMAFSPTEEVRVNSYVQLNKQKSRLIEQKLVVFVPGRVSVEGTRAVLPAKEDWEYRYLSLDGTKPLTPAYKASYDTTYTLVLAGPKRWLVDTVDAKALGEVK